MPSNSRRKKTVQAFLGILCLSTCPLYAQETIHQNFFTTSDQVKLHYLEAGQGETLLFIPGWLMPAEVWEKQILEFSKDYHVIALDPRSQGGSDITPNGNNPLRRSQDIQELMDHLQLDSVVLVGWSLGAFDGLAYLRQFGPDKLAALVLVDSPLAAPSTASSPSQRTPFLRSFEKDSQTASRNYVWSLFKESPPIDFYKKLAQAAARIPGDIALSTLDNTQPGDSWAPSYKAMREIPFLYAVTPKYATQAAYLQQVAPQARVEIFDNCGHALFVDQASRFNAILRDFLKQASLYPAGLPEPNHHPANFVSVAATPSAPHPLSIPSWTATPLPPSPTAVPVLTPTDTAVEVLPPTATPAETPIPTPIKATQPPYPTVLPLSASGLVQDGYFTTSDHVKLHYLEAGQGQAIVFIPGWLIPADIWQPQLEDLSKDYHVIALDPRSQGLSDMTRQGDEPLRQARDIQELLDHLHLDSVVLVGWSHGAFHVLAYIGEFGTDRLYGVVLVDSSLGAASSASNDIRQKRFLQQFKLDRTKAVHNFMWSLFKTPPPMDFLRRLNEGAVRTPTDIALALMNNIFPGDRWQPAIQVIRQVPLLYAVTPKFAFQANYLTQNDSLAKVEFFQNSGHALFVDEAEHFNSAMRAFLKQAALYPPGIPENKRKPGASTPGSYLATSHP